MDKDKLSKLFIMPFLNRMQLSYPLSTDVESKKKFLSENVSAISVAHLYNDELLSKKEVVGYNHINTINKTVRTVEVIAKRFQNQIELPTSWFTLYRRSRLS